jgi:hypothetical protein
MRIKNRWHTFQEMKSTISINSINLIRRRFRKETFFYFWRISIPIALVLTILFGFFYNETAFIFPLIIFFIFSLIELISGFIWITPHSNHWQRNYSIELKNNLLIERYGKTVKELELKQAISHINRFGVLMVNSKSNVLLKRIFDLNYIKIPPEIDNFNDLKTKIEEKTCAN